MLVPHKRVFMGPGFRRMTLKPYDTPPEFIEDGP